MITGVDHVQVAAPPGCEERARAFYGALLGMPELEKPAALAGRGGCWFAAGEGQLQRTRVRNRAFRMPQCRAQSMACPTCS